MSHYFSYVRLLVGRQQTQLLRDLARQGEAYRDHMLLWQLFPGDGMVRDFIFRRLDDGKSYYVVSARPPQQDDSLFQVQTKPYAPELEVGTRLRFDLRANPVISRHMPNGRSQRHDVLMDVKQQAGRSAQQLAQRLETAGKNWLLTRADQWGLVINENSVLQKGYSQHQFKRKGQRIQYSSLDYQGMAQVADPEKLTRVLLHGVGHGKGFGCGLLVVKRL